MLKNNIEVACKIIGALCGKNITLLSQTNIALYYSIVINNLNRVYPREALMRHCG